MIWQGAAIGVMMEIQLAVRTPTTAALGSTPIFIQAEVTRGIKIVRVARFDITCVRINGIILVKYLDEMRVGCLCNKKQGASQEWYGNKEQD